MEQEKRIMKDDFTRMKLQGLKHAIQEYFKLVYFMIQEFTLLK